MNKEIFSCSCPGGYAIAGDGHNCVDIDECATEQYDCPVGLSCKNIPGGYKCGVTCQPGTRLTDNDLSCTDIDECNSGTHECSQLCINTFGSYRCDCQDGFSMIDNRSCQDIDECALTSGRQAACSAKQTCKNTQGGYHCIETCPAGYAGPDCKDIDECEEKSHSCLSDQTCKNLQGTYECNCKQGFQMRDGKCTGKITFKKLLITLLYLLI